MIVSIINHFDLLVTVYLSKTPSLWAMMAAVRCAYVFPVVVFSVPLFHLLVGMPCHSVGPELVHLGGRVF